VITLSRQTSAGLGLRAGEDTVAITVVRVYDAVTWR